MRQLLAKAAEAVVEELGPLPESEVASLRLQYRDLAAALATPGLSSNGNGNGNGAHQVFELTRDQVNAFRVRLLQKVATEHRPVDGRELARVLASLDEVAERRARPASGEFAQRLASPDALRAVVEMAHDMRSPLGSILFLVDTIRRGQSGSVTQVQERQLGLIYGAALGLSTLASDVVDAINGDRLLDGERIPFSITEVMLGVCAIVRPLGEEKNLVLNTVFPNVDGRLGYPSALSRVLLNLSTNALRYTERGSVSIGCTEHSPTLVEFWVEDTGRGIPDSVLAMLFDGFRPGSVGIRFSSAGLGLAICRNLIEKMGSRLVVDTAVEAGTRFSFRIELPPA
ncbi:MAG TPA: HAMP domain-containing sensor histidine kinase [Gemmatimonadaceae bacterium]